MVWHNAARLDALGDGDVIGVEVDGTLVALYRIGGAIYATDGMCTHATGLLADGWVEDGAIECPLHQARFDIRTGKALCEPATEDLRIYPVKIEGADVLIDLEGTRPSHDPAAVVAGDRPTTTGAQAGTAAQSHDDRELANLASGVSGNGTLFTGQYVWPGNDLTRIPDWVYTDRDIYDREVERIFRGRTWNYVALEAELPNVGDFIRSNVGPTPVVVARAEDGSINVFENRCRHRAAEYCRVLSGTTKEFVCPYHQWTYNLKGDLIGVPFRRGVAGKGGMPADFRLESHGLRRLAVTNHRGVVFASYAEKMEPFTDYLGPDVLREFEATFDGRKLRVLGHYRHSLPGNWKLYHENLKDPYHATLLHTFLVTFGLLVAGNRSLMLTDKTGRHGVMASAKSDGKAVSSDAKKEMRAFKEGMTLREPRFMDFVPEFNSPWSVTMSTIWPNLIVQREMNTLGVRQIVPTGPQEFIMKWTMFGFEGDDDDMTRHRLRQGNLMGPAGFLGLEDNEAIKFVQDGMQMVPNQEHLVKLDPATPAGTSDSLISESAIRAMYQYWRREMGL
jgi:apoptosis-inducing factor 3